MDAPFPYFGTKKHYASIVWQRFGNPDCYIEPFAGSIAVLLRREVMPTTRSIEIIGDLSGKICNFWRAVQADPEAVARYCTWPIVHHDLTSRNIFIVNWLRENKQKLIDNPDFFDAKIAGWWAWGQCVSVDMKYCRVIDASRPCLHGAGVSISKTAYKSLKFEECIEYNSRIMKELADRISQVAIINRPWAACCTPALLAEGQNPAIFLDPPYKQEQRTDTLYDNEEQSEDAAVASYDWAVQHGEKYRIAYCCHKDDFPVPTDWEAVEMSFVTHNWSKTRKPNKPTDLIMFSPACLPSNNLFGD